MSSLLPQILGLAATVTALTILNRWITRLVQMIGWRVTGHEQVTLVIYYLLLFPGILLHELSHALMAKLLGMKVGSFSLGPKSKGQYVQLGAVTVSSGGPLRDSLVGLAPWLAGTMVLLAISYGIFNVETLGQAWLAGGWQAVLASAGGVQQVPDFWLWAYLIFTVSNAMTPSPADREPWLIAGLYLALALAVAYVVGALTPAAEALAPEVAGALPALTLAFLFTLGLDLAVAALLLILDSTIARLAGR